MPELPSSAAAVCLSDLFPSSSIAGDFGKGSDSARSRRPRLGAALLVALLSLALATAATAALTVDNTARATFSVGTLPQQVDSNRVSTVVRTPSTIEFLEYAPLSPLAQLENVATTSYLASSGFTPLAGPLPLGATTPLDLSQPLPLVATGVYHENEPIFIRLTDLDQNLDPTVRETVVVTLSLDDNDDAETLLLTETGPDTGIFAGTIQSTSGPVAVANGQLSVGQNSAIQAHYTDVVDGSDTSAAAVLVDPFGMVFDSSTGLPVSGAVVTLLDATTGLPATVFGDDGISTYPASVTSGGIAVDGSGRVYTFRPGFYRFPFIQPGRYLLSVAPPAAYRAPSGVSTSDIQNLPGAPFAIISPGSRGEEFMINPGPAIHIDLPVDPLTTSLYLAKSAAKQVVAVGDFLQYKITVENTAAVAVAAIGVSDQLPLGFRYRAGSTKIDGVAAADPALSAEGRTMLFSIGTVAAGQTAEISYVVEIAAGARLGRNENIATANDGGAVTSNTARAEVVVKEELFGSYSTITGRVFPQGCEPVEGDRQGVAGVRIYLENGTYVVTDQQGMYHFEGVKPGSHVVQLDLETIPKEYRLVSCEENDRFAGTPSSQMVDLQGGTLWRADFYAAPKPPVVLSGAVGIELNSVLRPGQTDPALVDYTITMPVGEVPLKNLRLTVLLPEGTAYQPGSSTLDAATLPDPEVMDNVLNYRLGAVKAGWSGTVNLSARVAPAVADGELKTRALLTFDTSTAKNKRTPLVENILRKLSTEERSPYPDITLRPLFEEFGHTLSDADKQVLDGIIADLKTMAITHISVIGHTNSTRIAPRSRHIFADNYALSRGRAQSVANYLAAGLNLTPEQMTIDGKGPDEPIATNKTFEGRALNRRVELLIQAEQVTNWSELKNIKEHSGLQQVEISALQEEEKSAAEQALEERAQARTLPEFDQAWLKQATPGLAFAWPYADYNPPIPSIKLAVLHVPGKQLKLLRNGTEVDPLYLDGTTKRSDQQVAVSLWIGVHIEDGDNLFEAVLYNEDGTEAQRVSRTIHYATSPVKAALVPERSRLIADGKTPTVIAVQLTDKEGHPARAGVVGEYAVDPPYLPLQTLTDLQQDPLTLSKSERLKFVVDEDGMARIELQPTTQTGQATVRFNLVNGEQAVNTWLTPGAREWILVGLAEGSAGYNAVAGNMESLSAGGVDEKFYDDGRLAFFAKGMIRGKWLLTAAFDSDKKGIKQNDSLHSVIDPDAYYTLYGDASTQQYEAASARSLYLKIERDSFYALFGDFNTGLSVTELSRYNRSLNGLKTELKSDRVDFNLFLSDTNQAFVKDEMRGDGTSGLYRLSRRNIVMNSESITIETRDRFRSELIVASQRLSRHLDYSIDYETGALFFKSPVFSRDQNFNPIYIVVDYEAADQSDLSFNYGGRGAVRFLENRLEVGASHIHEGRVGGEGNLVGVDVTWKLSEQTTARAELAGTERTFNGVAARGNAYLAELSHRSETVEGRAYIREQNSAFGLGQQMGSETGTRKIGVDGVYRQSDTLSYAATLSRQYNLAAAAVRDVAEAEARINDQGYTLHGGLRYAQDSLASGADNASEQVTVGGSFNLLEDRLVARVDHDQSLLRSNDNGDYPTRTTLGADYRLNQTASLFIAHEFAQGSAQDSETTRLGLKASPWEGGQLSSTVERQYSENGARVFSVTGLKQSWQLSQKWSLDAGLDRSESLSHPGNTLFNLNVPAASGGTDFTAVSTGAAYKEEQWSWTGRVDLRNSASEDKFGLYTSLFGEVQKGLGLSAALQAFTTEALSGYRKTDGNLRLGLAYRPSDSNWTLLDRLDYVYEEQRGSSFSFANWRLIDNLNANWKSTDRKQQVSLHYGAKYVKESIDDLDFSGFTDLLGLEARYDLTSKWDLGCRGNLLHSWQEAQFKYGSGISLGYNLVKNVWLSLGYNFTGFTDRDFSRADFTSEGPYLKFRMKFDQDSIQDVVKAFTSS